MVAHDLLTRTNPDNSTTQFTTTGGNYQDTKVSPGQTYSYSVTWVPLSVAGTAGTPLATNPVSVATPALQSAPQLPTPYMEGQLGGDDQPNDLAVYWKPVTGATSYTLTRTNPDGTTKIFTVPATQYLANEQTLGSVFGFDDTSIPISTVSPWIENYSYSVVANAAGYTSSAPSVSQTYGVDFPNTTYTFTQAQDVQFSTLPKLTAQVPSSNEIDLSWTPALDPLTQQGLNNGTIPSASAAVFKTYGSANAYYLIRTNPDGSVTPVYFSGATLTYADAGLPAGTYSYKVAPYLTATGQPLSFSNIASETTLVGPTNTSTSNTTTVTVSAGHAYSTAPINVRSSPSLSASVLSVEQAGTTGTLIGGPQTAGGYTWYQITWPDQTTGWSVNNYLIVSGLPESVSSQPVSNGIPIVTSSSSSTVSVTPSSLSAGGSVSVSWQNLQNIDDNAWIALIPQRSAPSQSSVQSAQWTWAYLNSCSKTAGSNISSVGTCSLTIPSSLANSSYVVQLFGDTTYNKPLLQTSPITVVSVTSTPITSKSASLPSTATGLNGTSTVLPVVATTTSAAPPTVSVTPSSLTAGGNVSVSWNIPNVLEGNWYWVGLFPQSTTSFNYAAIQNAAFAWVYLNGCSKTGADQTPASGACSLPIPTNIAPGGYFVELFQDSSYQTPIAQSSPIAVAAIPSSVSASPSSVAAGGDLSISWSYSNPTPGAWVALFPQGSSPTESSLQTAGEWDWAYLNTCTKTVGQTTSTSGTCTLPIDLSTPPGTYYVQLFGDGSYTNTAARSQPVIVTGSGGSASNSSSVLVAVQAILAEIQTTLAHPAH